MSLLHDVTPCEASVALNSGAVHTFPSCTVTQMKRFYDFICDKKKKKVVCDSHLGLGDYDPDDLMDGWITGSSCPIEPSAAVGVNVEGPCEILHLKV